MKTLSAAVLAGVGLSATTGCVERRMTVRSEPSNALVVVDGHEVGFTPVSTNFSYYGNREIKLIKDGFETKTIRQRISAPWYQWPGIDFLAEIAPWRIKDRRDYTYSMEPTMMVPNDELMQRAESVRAQGVNPSSQMLERAGLPAEALVAQKPNPRRGFLGFGRGSEDAEPVTKPVAASQPVPAGGNGETSASPVSWPEPTRTRGDQVGGAPAEFDPIPPRPDTPFR